MSPFTNTSAIAAFCSELREARRFQRIALDEVARTTRITLDYLTALETGAWDLIPPVYVRGYLGLYAVTVGMNRDKVLRDFDRITSAQPARENAALDDAPPLLSRPEFAAVTRQKIQAGWFVSLASYRRPLYLLGAMLILAVGFLLKLTQSPLEKIIHTPFAAVAAEYGTQIHAPYTVLLPNASSPAFTTHPTQIQNVTCICYTSATVSINQDSAGLAKYQLHPYDTLQVHYIQSCIIVSRPKGSLKVYQTDIVVMPDSSKPSNVDRFVLYSKNQILPQTAVIDSGQ